MGRLGDVKLLNQCNHSLPHMQLRAPLFPLLPWSVLERAFGERYNGISIFLLFVSSHFVLQALSASAVLGQHAAGSSGNGCQMT